MTKDRSKFEGMNMIQLQNNYTTPEQSKRLLESGVPADSADMYYNVFGHLYPLRKYTYSQWVNGDDGFTPCWSVGRLMEIFEICSGQVWQNEIIENYSKVDMLLEDFEDVEKKYTFDFSKLEEC